MKLEPATLPVFLPLPLAAELAGAQRATTEHEGVQTIWHVWGAPERPAVVLLHGGSGHSADFVQLPRLSRRAAMGTELLQFAFSSVSPSFSSDRWGLPRRQCRSTCMVL